jgi:hypothetical protein
VVADMAVTPRLAAEYVLAFLDLRRAGVGESQAVHDALKPLRGPGAEVLADAVSRMALSDTADNFEGLAGASGASSLAGLAMFLRAERPGPAMAAYLERLAEVDALAPSVQCSTAARFVIAFCAARDSGKNVRFACQAAVDFIRGPGCDELAHAVRADGWTSRDAVGSRLERLAMTWGSPVLADLGAFVRQDGVGASIQAFLVRSASAEAEAGVGAYRAALGSMFLVGEAE